jgi:GNAT superfamily N-acetyltransferase
MGVVAVRPVDRQLWPALEDLFGRGGASNGCWCMYWILGAEYHHRPRQKNKQALRRAATDGPAPGLLALDEAGQALGWCRLTPRVELAWLNRRRDLAPVDDIPVWSLPCFYIRRNARGQAIMASLIDAAVQHAHDAGAPTLEAYPIDTSVPGSTRNIFPGTVTAFRQAGFTEIARRQPDRPIMRHNLGRQNHVR